MKAQRLNSVRTSLSALAMTLILAAATGCSASQQSNFSSCMSALRASHNNNTEAIGSLDPDATPTPADRYRGATDEDASLVKVSVSRHPVR